MYSKQSDPSESLLAGSGPHCQPGPENASKHLTVARTETPSVAFHPAV